MRWSEFYGILKATDRRPNTVICLYNQSFAALRRNTMKFLIFMELLWENKFPQESDGPMPRLSGTPFQTGPTSEKSRKSKG